MSCAGVMIFSQMLVNVGEMIVLCVVQVVVYITVNIHINWSVTK